MVLRITASGAKTVPLGRSQLAVDRDSLIEYETLAFELPIRIFGKVAQDAVAQLIDLREPSGAEVEHDFLAPDAARAEDHHGSLGIQSGVIDESAPLRKMVDSRVDRPSEGADLGLVPVARVDEQVGLFGSQHGVPFGGG